MERQHLQDYAMAITSENTPPEHRNDLDMRTIFAAAFDLIRPHLESNGHWISQLDEVLALQKLGQLYPKIHGERLFLRIATVASAVASGRIPV
jgi:hypothetical protein